MRENPIQLKDQPGFLDRSELVPLPEVSLDESRKLKFLSQIKTLKDPSLMNLNITKREVDILRYYYKGKPAREVAETLGLSIRTIEHYLENIKDKLLCATRSDLFQRLQQMKEANLYSEIFL